MSTLYPDSQRTDWALLARRVVIWTATAAALITILGMVLSYAGLRSAYLGAGFPEWVASAAPFVVDLLTLVAYVALLVLPDKGYPAAVLIFGVLMSAGAQGYHASHGGIDAQIPDGRLVFIFGASFMVFAGLALHLFMKISERAAPADFLTALRGDDQPATLQVPSQRAPTPAPPEAIPHVPYPDAEKLLADYDTELDRELVRSVNGHSPALRANPLPDRLPPPTTAPPVPTTVPVPAAPRSPYGKPASRKRGPCNCPHHNGKVLSPTVRYRCQDGLAGKPNGCPACLRTREATP